MKHLKSIVSALAISLSIIGHSSAYANENYISVGQLLNSHARQGDTNRAFVLGYFAGLHDTVIGRAACMPSGLNLGEFTDGMMKILAEHEQKGTVLRSDNAAMLVSLVLAEAFPCTRKGKNV